MWSIDKAVDEQRQSRQEMGRILESLREVSVGVVRFEKRPIEGETPLHTSKLESVTVPPPSSVAPVSNVSVIHPVVG